MFTSFSGSSRRPRQVNLSGRKSHAFGSTGGGGGSQAALDRAQQERAQRQRERDTLKAAQTLQRVWRGHSTRQDVSTRLREEWDAAETVVSEPQTSLDSAVPYDSDEESLAQLHRLLRFVQTRRADDIKRIRHYGFRQMKTVEKLSTPSSGPWPLAYLRMQRIVLTALERGHSPLEPNSPELHAMWMVLHFFVHQAHGLTAQNAVHFYRTLAVLVTRAASYTWERDCPSGLMQSTLLAPLKKVSGYTLNAYEAFGYNFMPLPLLNSVSPPAIFDKFRDELADAINYKILAHAMSDSLKTSGMQSQPALATTADRVRFLSCFIYFHRHAHNFRSPEAYSAHKNFVTVVSVILNSLPVGLMDVNADQGEETGDINSFIREQIMSLINQEGIGNLLSGSTVSPDSSEEDKVEEARELANYALALLRFFPRKGDDIRMWLYLGPSNSKSSGRSMPAIKYFWEASKRSSVFKTIVRDSRAAIELLKPKAESSSDSIIRGSFWQASEQQKHQRAVTADEWRVILVFLELYTFILKLMDDEEFFSGSNDLLSDKVRDNNLPLGDIKELTTFLKNLGFTLYFNASDITDAEERDTSSGGFSFYNPKVVEAQAQKDSTEPSIGGVAGLSLDYVKGLVTGLVRSLYERDSRRKFLPANHWLMTSRFDMTGFIPSVVQEEESRHKIEEEDAEDKDEEELEEDFDDTPQLIGTGRTQHQRRLERLQRQQRKASRRRYLQAVAPRLEILQNMPFFIPFATRVQIFRQFVNLDMTKRRGGADSESWRLRVMGHPDAHSHFAKHSAKVRREHEFEDAFEQFYDLGAGLKEPIQITFVDQFDSVEAGIDGGGVTKEFLTSVTNRAFMPTDYIDMFVENDQHLLYPNPSAIDEHKEALKSAGLSPTSSEYRAQVTELLQRYEFLGRIIGKCLYEGILVDINFAHFFLRKWALTGGTNSAPRETGYRPTLNDLKDLDEALYQGLHQLKTYTGDVEDFALNFTVTDNFITDHTTTPKKTKAITRELVPGGSDMTVTNQNRLLYITYMARHRLQMQPYQQTSKFLQGLSTMINPSWLSMFNASELQTLIAGTSSSIDIADLRRNTTYGGPYVIGDDGLEHPTVQLFWRVLENMSDGERRAVLKFVTSTPRAPLLGFATLNPRFGISFGGSDESRLPSTSTCMNLLKLPMYKDEGVLRDKLLYSVFSGAGFDLS